MKKFLRILLIIVIIGLCGIIAWETPIVVKTCKKEEAIEILNKVYELENYEIVKNYAADGIAYAEKEKTIKDYATVIEMCHDKDCVKMDWFSNKYNNLAYNFDVGSKKCYPEYSTEIERYSVFPNERIIDIIKDQKIKDLKFTDTIYDGVEAIEIRIGEQEDIVIMEKDTGFVLTEYNENGGTTITYTYKVGTLVTNRVVPEFDNYTICVDLNSKERQKVLIFRVTNDEYLPEEFKTNFANANKDLVDELEIKPTEDN